MYISKKLKKKLFGLMIWFYDIFTYLIFITGIVFFIKFFIIAPFTVVGESMYPTFKEHDFILVNKIYDKIHNYKRGDIVVFIASGKKEPYIKRIIGLPGEGVKLSGGNVYICSNTGLNCKKLDEPYLQQGVVSLDGCGRDFFPLKSGYFVMGDNRMMSTDSSCCFSISCYKGAVYSVPKNRIMGKVFLRLFPNPRFF